MSIQKIVAIGVIFLTATCGWIVLGRTTSLRSTRSTGLLSPQVEALWGTPLVQQAAEFHVAVPGANTMRYIMPTNNDIQVELDTDYRQKGLIWYPTYVTRFRGKYTVTNEEQVTQKFTVRYVFPTQGGTYDDFAFTIDGKPYLGDINIPEGIQELVEVPAGKSAEVEIAYRTRGIREWRYRTNTRTGRVRGLNLTVATNFDDVDYPEGCLSPMVSDETATGRRLTWQANDLITREDIGIVVPERINPGPLTSRITFFAPVCLLFFFVLVATINIVKRINIHPMHYLFVAAGFFAFHLLLAYMAGLVNIHLAFAVSAIVSVVLVTGYLTAALKGRLPRAVIVAGQVFFLVLFSYSFFFKGLTGLTVAIGSVVTLAILMKVTAHVDWDEVFISREKIPEPIVRTLVPKLAVEAPEPDQA